MKNSRNIIKIEQKDNYLAQILGYSGLIPHVLANILIIIDYNTANIESEIINWEITLFSGLK